MIVGARKKKAFISFGGETIEKTIDSASNFKVWLHTIYNEEIYDFVFTHPDLTIVKDSNFEWTCIANTKGTFEIQVVVSTKSKKLGKPGKPFIEISSNKIILTAE